MALQTELHRHLDVSLRPSTLLRLLQERGLEPQSTSVEAFTHKLIIREPMKDLGEVLGLFMLFPKVYDRPEVCEQAAFEVAEDCWNEGTRRVELRYSPSFVSSFSNLAWSEALDGFEAGLERAMKKYPGLQAGLLCIGSREFGVDSTWKTVEFYLQNRHRFLGLDLAGDEVSFPIHHYREPYRAAKAAGARITIHAGEATGPDHVWAAIEDLGAERIGHGVASIRDRQLMDVLIQRDICLEVCPTSNWLTRAVPSLADHPLPALLRAGVPVSLNTDDPGMFGATLLDEARLCREKLGMTAEEVQKCFEHAERCSFFQKKG